MAGWCALHSWHLPRCPQLCINFANERLQQFFLHYVFYTEETIHKEEGVIWPNVELPDNQGCLDLVAKKDSGVLYQLDAGFAPSAPAQHRHRTFHTAILLLNSGWALTSPSFPRRSIKAAGRKGGRLL